MHTLQALRYPAVESFAEIGLLYPKVLLALLHPAPRKLSTCLILALRVGLSSVFHCTHVAGIHTKGSQPAELVATDDFFLVIPKYNPNGVINMFRERG